MKYKGLIDADKVLGKLDMSYDWELAEYEAFERTRHKLDHYGVLTFRELTKNRRSPYTTNAKQ